MKTPFNKDIQYVKFCAYGFLKNLKFYEPFLLLYLLDKLNNNYLQALSLYSIRFIIRTILEIPSGIIADALGRKGSLLFAYTIYILSFISYYLSENYFALLISSIMFGLGDAFRTGTHKAMIIEYLKIKSWSKHKTTYYGYTRSWSQTGSAISALIAAVILLTTNNYDSVFIATTIPYIIGLLLLFSYPKYLDNRNRIDGTILSSIKTSFTQSWTTLKKLKTISLLFNTSFYFGFHNAIKDLLQPIALSSIVLIPLNYGLSTQQKSSLFLGVFYSILYFISAFASRKAGAVGRLFQNSSAAIHKLSLIGVLICLTISVFIALNLPFTATILFLPFFSVASIYRPSAISEISNNIDGKIMATTLSIESQLGSLTASIIALLIGFSIEKLGLAYGLGAVSVISTIYLFITGRKK